MAAITRIDAALARIEDAAARTVAAPAGPVPETADAALADRHARLREATATAIDRIDRLLGAAG